MCVFVFCLIMFRMQTREPNGLLWKESEMKRCASSSLEEFAVFGVCFLIFKKGFYVFLVWFLALIVLHKKEAQDDEARRRRELEDARKRAEAEVRRQRTKKDKIVELIGRFVLGRASSSRGGRSRSSTRRAGTCSPRGRASCQTGRGLSLVFSVFFFFAQVFCSFFRRTLRIAKEIFAIKWICSSRKPRRPNREWTVMHVGRN